MKLNIRTFYLALISFCLAFSSFSNPIDEYKKITKNGKIGLQNVSTNQVVIPPVFDDIGWSDNSSLLVIDGVIGFKISESWGLIDLEKNQIVNSQYTILYPFTDNLLIVAKRSKTSILNEYGLINTSGKVITPLEFKFLSRVGDNLLAKKKVNGLENMGVLNSSLKALIPFNYNSIGPLENGFFAVKSDSGLTALFDSLGEQISGFSFENISSFDKEHFLIRLKNRKGLINLKGEILAAPIYKEITKKNEKYIASPFSKWTFLDADNKVLNSYFFDQVSPLSDTTFIIQTNNDVGVITQSENYLSYYQGLTILETKFGLSIVENKNYAGVIDSSGKIVIPINQDSVWLDKEFIFGKIYRSTGHSWTIYDRKGRQIGRFNYEEFERISAHRIRAKRNGKWGLLNNSGKEVSSFSYQAIGQFKNGYASAVYLNKFGVIDEFGNWVMTPQKDEVLLLKNRIIYNQWSENGIMNYEGNVLYRSQNKIKQLGEFFVEKNRDNKYILLNAEGNRAILEAVDTVYYANPSLYVFKKNDQWGMLNSSNMNVVELKKNVDQIHGMSEGHIMAVIDGHWGFLKEDGQLSIANRYDSLQFYSEGLAAINLIGKWGFIDQNENISIQPTFDFALPFQKNLSIVKVGDLYGIIDKAGKVVLEVVYDRIERTNDYILLYKNGLIGLANGKGELSRNVQYNSIKSINNAQFLVGRNEKFGVISLAGLDIVPVLYDKVIPFKNRFLVMEKPPQTTISIN